MAWTKRQIVTEAYAELALASCDFDLQPEELDAGLRRLDTMMATWSGLGVQVGYSMATGQNDSDLDQDSGLAMIAVEAVYMALACKIAASKGKALPTSTTRAAKQAYDSLILTVAKNQVQLQQLAAGTPRGAGRKPWRSINPYVSTPDTAALQSNGDGLDFNGLGN
jgi:hypothetical protein